MFAVIKTGGKQYKVSRGDLLRVEKLSAEAGDAVSFDSVLMRGGTAGITVGTPYIEGASVSGEVVEQIRDKKIRVFKKRRRKHSSKTLKGHRQYLTVVRITGLGDGDEEAATKGASEQTASGADDPLVDLDDIGEELDVAADMASDPSQDSGPGAGAAPRGDAARPTNLLDAPQGEADDLTKLPQVGDVFAGRLNDLGVFHFDQIAGWGPANWNWIDAELDIPGGIDRGGWLVIVNKIVDTRR